MTGGDWVAGGVGMEGVRGVCVVGGGGGGFGAGVLMGSTWEVQ